MKNPWSLVFGLLMVLLVASLAGGASSGSPFDHGATGDGVADDSDALQNALDNHSIVQLEGGTFRITRMMYVRDGGGVYGPGVVIHDFDVAPPPEHPSPHDVAFRLTGSGITLDGFKIRKVFVDGSYGHGIVVRGERDITVRNMEISGYSARYGIHIIECEGFTVSDNYIHSFMVNTETDMIQNSPAGLRVTRSKYGLVANNRIIDIEVGLEGMQSISPLIPSYGPQSHQADSMTIVQCEYVTISGNVCHNSGEGIDLLLSNHCTVTGNIVSNMFNEGIKMLGVSYTSVVGNSVSECIVGVGMQGHPPFDGECSGNTVTGNVFRNIGAQGSFSSEEHALRPHVGGRYSIIIRHHPESRYNIVTDNVSIDTTDPPTSNGDIRNNAGPTNLVESNLYFLKP